jgi:sterol desaturase/sphingolipid hydroxylase (fatty acid hydroxylase superfamily)
MVANYVLPVETAPTVIMVVLGVAYLEISEYWRHRLLHASDNLWPIHALHHHLDRMHIFRSGRVHFADGILRVLFTFVPALLLGVSPLAITCWMILLNALGPISHSNLNIHTPRFFNWLVATPMVHRVHHANADAMMRSNLAPTLPVVDMLFDTWLAPEENPVAEVGIEPDFFPKGFLKQLATPFVRLLPAGLRISMMDDPTETG